jgi:hypothetical protein
LSIQELRKEPYDLPVFEKPTEAARAMVAAVARFAEKGEGGPNRANPGWAQVRGPNVNRRAIARVMALISIVAPKKSVLVSKSRLVVESRSEPRSKRTFASGSGPECEGEIMSVKAWVLVAEWGWALESVIQSG